jgi:hypothetical protein
MGEKGEGERMKVTELINKYGINHLPDSVPS